MSQRNCQNVEIWTPNLHNSNQMPQTILYGASWTCPGWKVFNCSICHRWHWYSSYLLPTCHQSLASQCFTEMRLISSVHFWLTGLIQAPAGLEPLGSGKSAFATSLVTGKLLVWLFKPARCPFKSKTVVLHAQNPLRFWNELLWFQELCNSATCPRNMMWIDVEVGWFKAILNMVDFPCSLRPWPTPWPLFSVRSCIRWMCCIDCIEDSASIKAVAGQDRHAKCSQFKHMFQAR